MVEKIEKNEALEFQRKAMGKVQPIPTVNIRNERQLAMAYVPGSLFACGEIMSDAASAYEYTGKANRLAEISNGKGVFGMGDIGPAAVVPILESKALMLKLFGDIDTVPMAIDAPTPEDVVRFCRMIAPTVGGINIEDIGSPETFFVVRELSEKLAIPVFCDDQQGSAVAVLSAVKNSLALLGINIAEARIVVVGAGAAGIAATDLMLKGGARDVIILDESGILGPSHPKMNPVQSELSSRTNPRGLAGGLDEAIPGADILIGLSRENVVTKDHIKKMNRKPVVLALALPDPEIGKDDAEDAGAFIYASGNVQEPNAVMNIHAFPGIVRGALDVRAKKLTDSMLLAAADAMAGIIDRRNLAPGHITPKFFASEGSPRIAEAVGQTAINEGMAMLPIPEGKIYQDTWHRLFGHTEHI
jgi:malate dehydrogenase (oxaloacetate-decarboxylating)